MKFSQLPPISNVLTSSFVAILQAGKVYITSIADLLTNYYTKSEVDSKIASVQAGGVAWEFKVLTNQSLEANQEKEFVHGLANEDAIYEYLRWSITQNQYVKQATQPPETRRTENSIYLASTMPINNFKLVFFG